ncbi:hypothetical protein HID58_023432 [Brassica napus]|uniref:Uncharacterized protein n=1 Tax=Brassica napus TaxID=3708 RepID=A0ABQ8D227_BRANA|nr:hypothetical protein HID58_023432 [Brassica napus]
MTKSPPLSSSSSNLLHSLENPVNFNQKLLKLFEIVICRTGFGINIKGGKLENTYDQVIVQNISGVGVFNSINSFSIKAIIASHRRRIWKGERLDLESINLVNNTPKEFL